MRRRWQDRPPTSMFQVAELRRLIVSMMMLLIIGMLIFQSGQSDHWRWLTNAIGQPPKESKSPPPPLPKATGPTDEDPDEAAAAQEEYQVLDDGTEALSQVEMTPYDRMVFWVKNQSFERLYRRAKKDLWYTDLYDSPDQHRGDLVALNVEIRRAHTKYEKRYGFNLTEAWGQTEESRDRLYDFIVLDYPKEMHEGNDLHIKAKFAGYFLKLQGYQPGMAKLGARPEKAPLLIGRLEWEPSAVPEANSSREWYWLAAILTMLGLVFGIRFLHAKLRGKETVSRPGMTLAPTDEVIPIDVWLEQSDFSAKDSDAQPNHEDEKP
jgi:hypothetical protein